MPHYYCINSCLLMIFLLKLCRMMAIMFCGNTVQMYYQDAESGLKLMPRLTYNHNKLNSYSTVRVILAAQVLSDTVAAVLSSFGSPDAEATSKLREMVGSYFDCINLRSTTDLWKRKPFFAPYSSVNDPRFL